MICVLSPERIVLGGGVMSRPELLPLVHREVSALLNGYLEAAAVGDGIAGVHHPARTRIALRCARRDRARRVRLVTSVRDAADLLARIHRQAARCARRSRAAGPVRHRRLPRPLRRPDAAHAPRPSGTSRSSARWTSSSAGAGTSSVALPSESVTVDIHCVTKWSKLDTTWEGVSVDTLLAGVETAAEYVTAFCDGGYTTNLPLEDLTGGKAWVAYRYDGEPLDPEHGGPARLLVPHLYFWKSAKWVRGLRLTADRRARLLGVERLPPLRRPVAGAAVLGRLTWRVAEVVEVRPETPQRQDRSRLDVHGWPGHRAGQHVDVRLTAEDGYQAERSYSIASAPDDAHVELTVERIDDGEVSPYLTEEARARRS